MSAGNIFWRIICFSWAYLFSRLNVSENTLQWNWVADLVRSSSRKTSIKLQVPSQLHLFIIWRKSCHWCENIINSVRTCFLNGLHGHHLTWVSDKDNWTKYALLTGIAYYPLENARKTGKDCLWLGSWPIMLSMVTMVKKPKNQMTSNKQRPRLLYWPDR